MERMSERIKVQCGSVVVEEDFGNMRLSMSHTPTNHMTIERADVVDLETAIAAFKRAQLRRMGAR